MSIRNMEERVMTVCSICEIPREKSLLLLERHGWSCDYAIAAQVVHFHSNCRYYDGELDKIASEKKASPKRPIPIIELFRQSKTEPSKVEEVQEKEDFDDDGVWPKHLPMFQVNAVSLRSGLSLKTGTVLFLEAENKDLKIRRKAKVLTL